MKKSVRLPSHVVPKKYHITLKPDLEAFTFSGQEEIAIQIRKATTSILLHAKELEISGVSVCVKNKSEVWAKQISYNERAETVTFSFPQSLKKGSYTLKLAFKGVINDYMRGFYRSSYLHEGVKKHLATSQFEATDARRAFPCFDEPAAKAVFELDFIIPENLSAISNTLPSAIKEHEAGYKVVSFTPSPKMSTYLVALIVGEFEYLEGRTNNGVVVRVHTTPGKKQQGRFALQCAIRTLEFYDQYFDIPYPLKTLDMVAIPDFAHGAMENWGAVTYRESALLVDEQNSSTANKQWVALVIAHELAHQWFGNLVTMEWWTHLWLNEGFASYIEYLAVNKLFPKWDIWTQFAYNDLGVALKLDALANTHPIEVEVHHPNEIGEIFDEVSYSKGSSVIRMLADYLGEKDFRNGLRYYLEKHAYGNASTIHLWRAFEKVSKKPVAKIMKNWTAVPGYPLLVATTSARRGKSAVVELSQQRFFSNPAAAKVRLKPAIWHIPISVQTMGNKAPGKYLLSSKRKSFTTPLHAKLKLNAGETGFFRVQYDANTLQTLAGLVRSKQLKAIDRLGIIRDLFALAEAGKISSAQALRFAQNYKNEDDYTVWVELASGLDTLDGLLYSQPLYDDFRRYCRQLFSPLAKKLSWRAKTGESHTAALLRSLALSHAAYYGDADIIKHARQMFYGNQKINPDLRGLVYAVTAEYGGQKEFNRLVAKYGKEALHEERNRLGRALGKFRDKQLVSKGLNFMLSSQVRNQDTPLMIAAAFGSNFARRQTWEFTKSHWPELLKRYGHGGHLLGRFIKPLAAFSAAGDLADVAKFFKSHPAPAAERTVKQTLEAIESNIAWLKRDEAELEKFLRQVHGPAL
ncbi:MAG: M1 family metallopeptidase [Patescibacteria group bacterium]|nr:M1 family metallopeptidase [Patescibacteria group bacterium]